MLQGMEPGNRGRVTTSTTFGPRGANAPAAAMTRLGTHITTMTTTIGTGTGITGPAPVVLRR